MADEGEETEDTRINPEDYIFSLHVPDHLRQIFVLVLLVGNFASVNVAVVFFCLSWFVKSTVERQITFLQEFYNPQVVPTMVGLSGLAMLVASVLGVKAGMGGRVVDDEGDWKGAAELLFVYSVAAAVAFVSVLIAALTCFIEIAVLGAAFGDGFRDGMEKYKNNSEIKPEIDAIQIEYKCCGAESYKDWYNASWVDSKYLDTGNGFVRQATKKGEYFGKDVPFSCCRWKVMRPCVDTRVEDKSYHSKYNFPDDLTLNTRGCAEAVSGFIGHSVYKGVGLFVFFCALLWGGLTVVGRYLNTSMMNVSAGEPPVGWLIPYVKPQKSGAQKGGDEEEDEDEYE